MENRASGSGGPSGCADCAGAAAPRMRVVGVRWRRTSGMSAGHAVRRCMHALR